VVSRSSSADIGRPRYFDVAATGRRPGTSWKKYLLNAAFWKRRPDAETKTPHFPASQKKDEINVNAANRTRVRAKMRVTEIRNHSRPEMKKAS